MEVENRPVRYGAWYRDADDRWAYTANPHDVNVLHMHVIPDHMVLSLSKGTRDASARQSR